MVIALNLIVKYHRFVCVYMFCMCGCVQTNFFQHESAFRKKWGQELLVFKTQVLIGDGFPKLQFVWQKFSQFIWGLSEILDMPFTRECYVFGLIFGWKLGWVFQNLHTVVTQLTGWTTWVAFKLLTWATISLISLSGTPD